MARMRATDNEDVTRWEITGEDLISNGLMGNEGKCHGKRSSGRSSSSSGKAFVGESAFMNMSDKVSVQNCDGFYRRCSQIG
jgi:hypothetical protein